MVSNDFELLWTAFGRAAIHAILMQFECNSNANFNYARILFWDSASFRSIRIFSILENSNEPSYANNSSDAKNDAECNEKETSKQISSIFDR